MLSKLISLLYEATSKSNKSDTRIIGAIEKALKQQRKKQDKLNGDCMKYATFLLFLHEITHHLPSFDVIIRFIHHQ